MTKKRAREIAEAACLRAEGGTFYPNDGRSVDVQLGYEVAMYGQELVVPVRDVHDVALVIYNKSHYITKPARIGVWVNKGRVYIDTTVWLESRIMAEHLGYHNEQLAIWDWAAGKEINLKQEGGHG